MLRLARALFGGARRSQEGPEDAIVDDAIEKLIDGTDGRLRVVSGYRRKLREPVAHAIGYVVDVLARLPPPLEASLAAYGRDACVHAFFPSPTEMQRMFSVSPAVRASLARAGDLDSGRVFAGLGMAFERRTVFATVESGGVVQRDVQRSSFRFHDHRLAMSAPSAGQLLDDLKDRGFMVLVERALERLTSLQSRETDLTRQRSLLRRKLDSLRRAGLAMQPLAAGGEPVAYSTVESTLDDVERELTSVRASVATLDDHLEQISQVMRAPQDHLRVEDRTLRVTPDGYEADADGAGPSDEVRYSEIRIAGSAPRATRIVSFPVAEIPPPEKFRPVL